MKYISVKQAAELWSLSERSVRNYCAHGRIDGAFLTGKTWNIPENATRPTRTATAKKAPSTLSEILADEMQSGRKGGIYHKIQVELTYNSNHIEGSRLTADQTRYIFETNTIGVLKDETVNVDDIIETSNHFRCIDLIIENRSKKLSEAFIKELHRVLKYGTSDSRKAWFAVGDYKKQPNEVGGEITALPGDVHAEMHRLLSEYENGAPKSLEDIVEFHARFEKIHPFQDGNGRVGRLIMFKECLRFGVVPFIIDESIKLLYYNGLKNWDSQHGYLVSTCQLAQDAFREMMGYFEITEV